MQHALKSQSETEKQKVFDGIPECIVFTYFLKNRQVAYVS